MDAIHRDVRVYLPFLGGRYEVSAGLTRLGEQAVHGRVETHVFAFDRAYAALVASKVRARQRALHEYYVSAGLAPDLRAAALDAACSALARDSEGGVTWDGANLRNHWLGWTGTLDPVRGTLEGLERHSGPLAHLVADALPLDALDFVGMNTPEDLAILARRLNDGVEWLAALHVLNPQHWDPRDKVGRDFRTVHAPVAGAERMNDTAPRLTRTVAERGPFLRFAWGVSTGERLDHHPSSPSDADRDPHAPFDPHGTFVRVERQTLTPLLSGRGALFTIRPLVYPLAQITADPRVAGQLASALRTMTPEQRAYKGLVTLMPALLGHLDALTVRI